MPPMGFLSPRGRGVRGRVSDPTKSLLEGEAGQEPAGGSDPGARMDELAVRLGLPVGICDFHQAGGPAGGGSCREVDQDDGSRVAGSIPGKK